MKRRQFLAFPLAALAVPAVAEWGDPVEVPKPTITLGSGPDAGTYQWTVYSKGSAYTTSSELQRALQPLNRSFYSYEENGVIYTRPDRTVP